LIIAVRFRLQLPKAPLAGLFVAVMLLGLSVSLDAVIEFSNKQTVIEDGLKFVGLMVWSVYWIDRASTAMALQRSAP
jgi:hypothetical protein